MSPDAAFGYGFSFVGRVGSSAARHENAPWNWDPFNQWAWDLGKRLAIHLRESGDL